MDVSGRVEGGNPVATRSTGPAARPAPTSGVPDSRARAQHHARDGAILSGRAPASVASPSNRFFNG